MKKIYEDFEEDFQHDFEDDIDSDELENDEFDYPENYMSDKDEDEEFQSKMRMKNISNKFKPDLQGAYGSWKDEKPYSPLKSHDLPLDKFLQKKKTVKLKESDLERIVKKILSEQEVEEGILDNVKDFYRGVKGMKRGYGMDYFQNMSRLEKLISKLKKLDVPNHQVMNELSQLKSKVSALNMPQQRKNALLALIDNSLFHFEKYSKINDQILAQIKTLNLDSWK